MRDFGYWIHARTHESSLEQDFGGENAVSVGCALSVARDAGSISSTDRHLYAMIVKFEMVTAKWGWPGPLLDVHFAAV